MKSKDKSVAVEQESLASEDKLVLLSAEEEPASSHFGARSQSIASRTRARLRATTSGGSGGSGRLIGSVAIGITSVQHRRGEIGFVFHRDVWSQGYATEAAQQLLQFGFDRLQLRRISATCHPDNHASAHVLEKAGLHYEGRMRSHLLVRGAWRDSLLYAALNSDR